MTCLNVEHGKLNVCGTPVDIVTLKGGDGKINRKLQPRVGSPEQISVLLGHTKDGTGLDHAYWGNKKVRNFVTQPIAISVATIPSTGTSIPILDSSKPTIGVGGSNLPRGISAAVRDNTLYINAPSCSTTTGTIFVGFVSFDCLKTQHRQTLVSSSWIK